MTYLKGLYIILCKSDKLRSRTMKIKAFTLALSIFVILFVVVSCVSLPFDTSEDPSSPGTSSGDPLNPSSEETLQPESGEPSTEPPSGDISSGEESEPPSEEPSQIEIDLPYKTFEGLTISNLGVSEYDEYFQNSMFIGNSIMVHFYNFISSQRASNPKFLGKCAIFSSSNFSSLEDSKPVTESSWHPTYQKVKMNSADAVEVSGVDTVYISVMALNELSLHSGDKVQGTYNTTIKLIESVRQKNPDVAIVILSNTYMVYNFNDYPSLNNGNISSLNNKVLDYCNENGIDFIDVSTFLMDGNVLADKYCRDYEKTASNNGCHLTTEAYCFWAATLRNYAYLKGINAWENPESMPLYTRNS